MKLQYESAATLLIYTLGPSVAASDGYINTYIDDCEGVVSGRKIATAVPKELIIITI